MIRDAMSFARSCILVRICCGCWDGTSKSFSNACVLARNWWRQWNGLVFRSSLVLFTCGCLLVYVLQAAFVQSLTSISIVSFSLSATEYPLLNDYNLVGNQIEAETLLQFVGGINKFMDAVVAGSVSFLGAAYVSFGMTQDDGASIADFDLSDCMINPFKAIYTIPRCYWQKRVRPWLSLLNIVTRLVTSVCCVLLPISINTLLMPKLIWHPLLDRDGFSQSASMRQENHLVTPMVYVSELSWHTSRSRSLELGEMDGTISLIASQVYEAFHDLHQAFVSPDRGWYTAKRYPNYVTAIDTRPSKARAVTARAEDVQNLWRESKIYGPEYAKHAVEFWGTYNVSTPSVEVYCERNETTGSLATLDLHSLFNGARTTRLDFGPIPSLGFEAQSCYLTTSHALFGLQAWYLPKYDTQINASTRLDADKWVTYAQTRSPPGFQIDVHDPLISEMQAMRPTLSMLGNNSDLHRACHQDPFPCFLVQFAHQLRRRNSHYLSDESAMSHVLAFWAQHTVTLADWTLIADTTVMKGSAPNWYKVYAAGPRLRWSFAILLVPMWLFVVLFTGVCLILWKKVRLLACTTAPGMMFVRKSTSQRSKDVFNKFAAKQEIGADLCQTRIRVDANDSLEAV